MANTGHTLDHSHDYEDGQERTEPPTGAPMGHTHRIPSSGEWTSATDGHKHYLPTRASDAAALERSLKDSGGLKGAMAKLAAEPEQEKRR